MLPEPFRAAALPDEVSGEPYVPPVSGRLRLGPRAAAQGLAAPAGCRLRSSCWAAVRRDCRSGERISIEFLIDEPTFEPHHMPFIKNLATLGSRRRFASRRSRAVSQTARRDGFDF